ncbi:GatB/GatE catalytic domain-containing protein [Podospora appendiculata]|uniref:Glutamyl-tRNA(Gln) amidotransferase subunit B, mitochondrial n=1 Tax=Podospora appendiculata TaxID=314037 RepID=A0AAE1CDW7_9PEZI|nr:GatB/GatE catalytic domain-containing protein [Podospora appendiculata]
MNRCVGTRLVSRRQLVSSSRIKLPQARKTAGITVGAHHLPRINATLVVSWLQVPQATLGRRESTTSLSRRRACSHGGSGRFCHFLAPPKKAWTDAAADWYHDGGSEKNELEVEKIARSSPLPECLALLPCVAQLHRNVSLWTAEVSRICTSSDPPRFAVNNLARSEELDTKFDDFAPSTLAPSPNLLRMARISTGELRRYLLSGQIGRQGCQRVLRAPLVPRSAPAALGQTRRFLNTTSPSTTTPSTAPPATPHEPLRKQLKEQAKALKASGKKKKKNSDNQTVPGWELTVGIEIHAQLNTARKLFSPAATSFNDPPNSHVTLFDVAMPGSQPVFQPATLVPAVRAALALNCTVQPVSHFDRKHYFHWDQPAGYQITQYYEPFARDGRIVLNARDGIAAEDGDRVEVGIQQVQLEQDTAKTTAQPGDVQWLDFNRVGVPLIEIITRPQMHHPATAAALVRKIQMLLTSVDACVSGMEAGGLRADVNVSVRRTGDPAQALGTRTEIKNLSSFKAVEDAIIAERDRQIALLEAGGVVLGETRGWSLGSTETRRLRGKEGEVDYRYMPDPDLGPVVIGAPLVKHLAESLGMLPDAEIDQLMEQHGLSSKDALSLMLLDSGARVQYYYNVLDELDRLLGSCSTGETGHALLAANWCLHELGKLTDVPSDLRMTADGECSVPSAGLAAILSHLYKREITAKVAKDLLWAVFRTEISPSGVTRAIESEGLWFKELRDDEYAALADSVVEGEDKVLKEFARFKEGKSRAYPHGKLMFLVGKMMRAGPEERMDPASAERVMKARLDEVYVQGLEAAQ